MWVSRAARALRHTANRRCSTFYELYGRAPAPAAEAADKEAKDKTPPLSCSTAGAADEAWETCQAVLQRFKAQLYASPAGVPPQLPRDALASIAAVYAGSPMRRAAAATALWQDALELRTHTPAADLHAAADTTAALLHAGKAALGYEMGVDLLLHNVAFRQHVTSATSPELVDALRFLSGVVLCAAADGRGSVPAAVLPLCQAALQNAKAVIAAADKSKRAELAHAVEVFAWSFDWLCGDAAAAGKAEAAEVLAQLHSLFPQWLLYLGAPFDAASAAASVSSFALLSPRWLHAMAQNAASAADASQLDRLLRHAQRTEATVGGYKLFQLSTRMADLLVSRFPHFPASSQAVTTYGTALHRDALRHFGSTKDGRSAALAVLQSMSGAEPYFVLRDLMRHESPEAAAAAQEAGGDVLTGNTQLQWRTALDFTMGEVAGANPHWRSYLPETLRLLSDAGQSRTFWALLAEYDGKNAGTNLSVASSLAQVMGRTGKWWHAMEVLDLVAAASPPRTETEESFLAAACTDTLRALVHGRRWQEALTALTLIGDAVPAHEAAVVSQLLMTLPDGAPWAAALGLAREKGFAVDNAASLLRVLHGNSSLAAASLSAAQQRVAVPIFVQHGRWDLLQPLVEQRDGDGVPLWRALVQALERCPDAVEEAVGSFVAATLPASLARDARTFRLVAQLCLQHGWYGVLAEQLQAATDAEAPASTADAPASPPEDDRDSLHRLREEYRHLLRYLQNGTRPPLHFVFADSYVIHQFVACVAARQLAVMASLPPSAAGSKKQASAYLRVPHQNLGTLHRGDASKGTRASVKVYTTAAAASLPEHVLHRSADGMLFGYKVPGVPLFAAARGLVQTLQLTGVYLLAYNMSAASSGVYVLHPATTSLRRVSFTLHVRLCLASLPEAPVVQLLATSFFTNYAMTWHGGTRDRHEVEAAVPCERGLDVRAALRVLKRDVNAEGWGLVETEAGAGDLYHIRQVRIASDVAAAEGGGVQVVTCRERSLQPINADAEAVGWESEL